MNLFDLKTESLGKDCEFAIFALTLLCLCKNLFLLISILRGCSYRFSGFACFSPYDFVFVFYSFSFVWLGRSDFSDVGPNLTDPLFIGSLNGDESFFYFKTNSLGCLNIYRVLITDYQNQGIALDFGS